MWHGTQGLARTVPRRNLGVVVRAVADSWVFCAGLSVALISFMTALSEKTKIAQRHIMVLKVMVWSETPQKVQVGRHEVGVSKGSPVPE
jgi:hypothetical protein